MERQDISYNIPKIIAFFDVFISAIKNENLTLQTYHKWT